MGAGSAPRSARRAGRIGSARRAVAWLGLAAGLTLVSPGRVAAAASMDAAEQAVAGEVRPADPHDRGDAQQVRHAHATKPGVGVTFCLVCGEPVTVDDITLTYRGRTVHLHRELCIRAWNAARAKFFAALQPHGALFQEHEVFGRRLATGWLILGVYLVVGLAFGAGSGYLAVARGRSPGRWFLVGLAVNVVGLAALLTRSRRDVSHLPAGVPGGLAKVPTTRPPEFCPACGGSNHPAASECVACGAALEPSVEPETARV